MANYQRSNTYATLSNSDLLLLAHQAMREANHYLDGNRLPSLPLLLGIVPHGQTVVQWHDLNVIWAEFHGKIDLPSVIHYLGCQMAMRGMPVAAVFLIMPADPEPRGSNAVLAGWEERPELVTLLGVTHIGSGVKVMAEVIQPGPDYVKQLRFTSSCLVRAAGDMWSILPYFWIGYADSIARWGVPLAGAGGDNHRGSTTP